MSRRRETFDRSATVREQAPIRRAEVIVNSLLPTISLIREDILVGTKGERLDGIDLAVKNSEGLLQEAQDYLDRDLSFPTPQLLNARNRVEKLHAELKMCRNVWLRISKGHRPTQSSLDRIQREQVSLRRNDLDFLILVFAERTTTIRHFRMKDKWRGLLIKASQADPLLPLEPQLGFSVTDY